MTNRLFILSFFFIGSFALMAQEPASTNGFDLNAVSGKYADTWQGIETLQQERLTTIKTQYLAVLEKLYQKAISGGNLDGVIAVKAEKDRMLTDSPLSDGDRAAMAAEIKEARAAYDQHVARVLKEHGDQLRQLHDKYKKMLDYQEKKLTAQDRVDEALAVRAEKERITDDLPEEEVSSPAPTLPPVTNAAPVPAYVFYKPGTEPPAAQKDTQKLQPFFASPQARAAGMVYTLDVAMILSKSKLQTSKNTGTGWYSKTESGTVSYRPRIFITGRNKSIAAGSKLVVEYFSGDLESSGRQRDCVEIIALPDISKGKTVVVDGKGIGLYRYENEQNYGTGASKSKRGRDFEGLILSLFAPSGALLFQQMTSQTLEKEISAALPAEKPCPQDPQPVMPR